VIFGCAAYEAGNMIGAVSGLRLIGNLNSGLLTTLIFIFCGILLWFGKGKKLVQLLGVVVILMAILFISAASGIGYSITDVLKATMKPSVPAGSGIITLGLIGTTIVPYNLFLASGISKGQKLVEMRLGIIVAVLIGGFISLAIMVAGTAVNGEMSFLALQKSIEVMNGKTAGTLFALGLFAAGLTSAITAPLASAITGRTLLSSPTKKWNEKSMPYRLTWMVVLLTGFIFGISDVKPIPVIILAQAINGFLLPFVAVFLLLIVNDNQIIPQRSINKSWLNILTLLIVFVSVFLGLNNLSKAIFSVVGLDNEFPGYVIIIAGISIITTLRIGLKIFTMR